MTPFGKAFSTTDLRRVTTDWFRRFSSRFEIGETLLIVYFAVIIRQWLYGLPQQPAWYLTTASALLVWFFYVATKERLEHSANRSLLLIVGLPLLAAYALRFPFPDSSFDVWGLRLFHGERALEGHLYWPGEFFPTAAPFNPTPDMVTAIFRHALGYRLGTVVNLLVLLWTSTFVDKLLRPYVTGEKLRAFCVLLVVFAEQLLFEINNYMPDLLAMPLLLEATRLTLDARQNEFRTELVSRVALLLGMAVGLKLSNGAVAAPIVIVWVWRAIRSKPLNAKPLALSAVASVVLFFAPFFSFMIWVYRATGSPIYPLYNKVFQSPLYPPFNGWDNRWGGYGLWEILTWPIVMFLEPVRTSELPVYSGRLSLAFIVSFFCVLFFRRLDHRTRLITFILVTGTLLWSLTMGYIRYGLYLELLSGILLIAVASILLRKNPGLNWRTVLASTIGVLMIAQMVTAGVYLMRTEWSLRPTVFTEFQAYKRESKLLFRDRSIRTLLGLDDLSSLNAVDVWIVSGIKMAGLLPFLNKQAPCVSVRSAGLLLAPANRAALTQTLENYKDKNMWSMVLQSDYNDALFALRGAGLRVVEIREFNIPFFSKDDIVPAYFFRVAKDQSSSEPKRTEFNQTINPQTVTAKLETVTTPTTIKPDIEFKLFASVTNSSNITWSSLPSSDQKYRIQLTARWTKKGNQVGNTVAVTLPYDLRPGETAILPVPVRTPVESGEYILVLQVNTEEKAPIEQSLELKIRVGL